MKWIAVHGILVLALWWIGAQPAAKLLKLGEQCSRLPVIGERSAEEMLYDENGLPR